MRRDKKYATPIYYLVITLLSYLFTFYHFAPHYAIRIYLFLSIFLVAFAVSLLAQIGVKPIVRFSLIFLLAVFGMIGMMDRVMTTYNSQNESFENVGQIDRYFSEAMDRLVPPGSFVFARSRVYRLYILPYHLVHGLKAYDSGEYYQLSSELSDRLKKDYDAAMICIGGDCLDPICDKYGIEYAVIHAGDFKYPVFQHIDKNWERLHSDRYFAIFKRK